MYNFSTCHLWSSAAQLMIVWKMAKHYLVAWDSEGSCMSHVNSPHIWATWQVLSWVVQQIRKAQLWIYRYFAVADAFTLFWVCMESGFAVECWIWSKLAELECTVLYPVLVFTANHHQWVVPHFLLLVLKTLSSFVAACFIWPQKMRDVNRVKTLLSPNRYWLENCLFSALTIIMPLGCKLWCTHSSAEASVLHQIHIGIDCTRVSQLKQTCIPVSKW